MRGDIYAFAKEKRRKGALLSDKNDKDVELLEYADAYIQDAYGRFGKKIQIAATEKSSKQLLHIGDIYGTIDLSLKGERYEKKNSEGLYFPLSCRR